MDLGWLTRARAPVERRETTELLLQRLRAVPAVQQHLLQVHDVPSNLERVVEARGVADARRVFYHRGREDGVEVLPEGRSIRSDGGVEFKGVRWS